MTGQHSAKIAIVGIGGIFPGAPTLDDFWRLIASGMSSARDIPAERWSINPDDCLSDSVADDCVYSKRACLIEGFELDSDGLDIDADLLGRLDPMCHLLLHAGRNAWQDANQQAVNRERTGIIIGNIALPTEYASRYTDDIFNEIVANELGLPLPPRHDIDGLNRYVAGLPAGVLAQALGLGAGSYTLDAACASSLYAIKYAADELISGRADCMLAGGLSRPDSQYTQMGFSQLRALSASGNCAPFSHQADGLVVGEGAGIIILKRLEDALRDQDHIYACFAGAGLSNDIEGNLFLPASEGQYRAMQAAYHQSQWPVDSIQLIECHGTGTPKGDATELQSLSQLWSQQEGKQQCVIGSVKSNVGHLLTGAGIAGVIKVLLAMKHKTLPPTANFKQPSEHFDLYHSPFRVLQQGERWRTPDTHPRRAAVSAFGFGGINAHLLFEEWRDEQSAPLVKIGAGEDEAIAIVAAAAHAGDCEDITALRERFFNRHNNTKPQQPRHCYGAAAASTFTSFHIDKVDVPIGRFRIPPTELSDCLPQQLLMLNVAADALEQLDRNDEPLLRCGTYIGIGLDPNTCNFHYRWQLKKLLDEHWATDLSDSQKRAWLQQLRDALFPPLTANRTMGALGGIVASRVARALRIGGPSFTVSNEECSGMRALQMGVDALRRGEVDQALIGAVDFASELRAALSHDQRRKLGKQMPGFLDKSSDGTITGDGACALVLKRHSDARRDGDTVIACIDRISSAHGGSIENALSDDAAWQRCLADAYTDERLQHLDLLLCHASGHTAEDQQERQACQQLLKRRDKAHHCALSSAVADIGHCGAASSLMSVLKAALSLHYELIPQTRIRATQQRSDISKPLEDDSYASAQTHYWLRNRISDQRLAGVNAISCDGTVMHTVLRASDQEPMTAQQRAITSFPSALFLLHADDPQGLIEEIRELAHFCEPYADLNDAAHHWWHSDNTSGACCCSLLLNERSQLHSQIDALIDDVTAQRATCGPQRFYLPDAQRLAGDLAFVFPGSGNHFAGMAASHSSYWPQVFDHQDRESDYHCAQFADGRFWSERHCEAMDHSDVIFGQVCTGTMIHDCVTRFGLKADAVIGYSLGETAGFFSTRTWTDRDGMLQRIKNSELFTTALAGPCTAAQQTWNDTEHVDWNIAVVDRDAVTVRQALTDFDQIYLLIINTPNECVIGGDREQLDACIAMLQCQAHPISGVTTVHCPVAKVVEKSYRDLHLFDCHPPGGVRFYSGIWGRSYEVNTANAADSIVGQALEAFDYTRVIEQAYADGIRLFIEMGPRSSCTRMIDQILDGKDHLAVSASVYGQDAAHSMMQVMAGMHMAGQNVDLEPFYGHPLQEKTEQKHISVNNGRRHFDLTAARKPEPVQPVASAPAPAQMQVQEPEPAPAASVPTATQSQSSNAVNNSVINQWQRSQQAMQHTHQQFLQLQENLNAQIATALQWQLQAVQGQHPEPAVSIPASTPCSSQTEQEKTGHPINSSPSGEPVLFDYNQCMEIAVGKLGNVLPEFAEADTFPTRVRLPDEPLMLAHRIMRIDGEARSMTSGRIVTEHDIVNDAWYLDGGVIPTCIAVEAGQADLFLSGYLGIDFITRGEATYRLLDAEVTFHAPLPGAGSCIRYDIQILEFFKQGDTYLFRFQFDATVNGELLLTMRKGIAGFFTQRELDAGQGVVMTTMDKQQKSGVCPQGWQPPLPMSEASYSEEQLQALRNGDLAACFGVEFADLPLAQPATIPDGRMRLVHRITALLPRGGRFGLGQITGEADIHPDDWFLTCHFCDDMVMPGTLMYECCLHTLRVFLLRMGWVGEADQVHYEPIPGEASVLKCRGQVLQSTRTVTYQLTIKEIGYEDGDGRPYCLAEALMSGDGKPIVHMKNMSLRIAGLDKAAIDRLWAHQANPLDNDPDFASDAAIFTDAQITAFAEGKPSEAFGDRYRVFDDERRIARLPRDPFKFLNRITCIRDCQQWQLSTGATIVARYDVPPDAWYFEANEQGGKASMPFSVLLETALQPCGWLAAYLGSALTSDIDIKFRNLGGNATQFIEVTPDIGTLSTRIVMTGFSSSGGMIIQNYDMEMWSERGLVYRGDTVFGFFSESALANQIGIRDAGTFEPSVAEQQRGHSFTYPSQPPFPDQQMRMIDHITHYDSTGGRHGLGLVIGSMTVNPDSWFFRAHFYQDPVIPGSLGLESFQQLLKVAAWERWGAAGMQVHFQSMPPGHTHSWLYRGQVIPSDSQVSVQAELTQVDEERHLLVADGFLLIDGRVIYRMMDFGLEMQIL